MITKLFKQKNILKNKCNIFKQNNGFSKISPIYFNKYASNNTYINCINNNINIISINKKFYSTKNDDKGVKSSLDLFDVFEEEIEPIKEEKVKQKVPETKIVREEDRATSGAQDQTSAEAPKEESSSSAGIVPEKDVPLHEREHKPKLVQVKRRDVLQGQKKANLILQTVVGYDLGTALKVAQQTKNKAAQYIVSLLRTGRAMCQRRFGAERDDRILVKEAWVTRGQQSTRLRFHARGRMGMAYKKKSSMVIVLRYFSPQDDEIFLRRLEDTLNKLEIPKNKLNVVMKRGRRSLVNLIAKGCRLTRHDLKSKVSYLVRKFPEYKPIPVQRTSILKSARWGK